MSRRCEISGKGVLSGNNVSHAHNKSRRRFIPNLQNVSILSEILDRSFKMKLAVHTLRSIEKCGGLDEYLISTSDINLTADAIRIKKSVKKARLNST